jgi:RNA polymerase sigma factor (sigma-70 family)
MNKFITYLRKAVGPPAVDELSDGQLLDRFLKRRDRAALEILVQRHSAMVWGVCRRVLCNEHDAEDAFQATFLVLIRKAASIASRAQLANYLYGVAHLTARKARQTAAKRRAREKQVTNMPEPQPARANPDAWLVVRPFVDEALSRLPDKYRVAIVVCDLEGKTRKEAARQLGVAEGTVASRLARARTMLAKRLACHLPGVSAATLLAVLCQNAMAASAPAQLVSATTKALTLLAAGEMAAGSISARVTSLTEGVLKAMFLAKLRRRISLLLAIATLALGIGALTWTVQAQIPNQGTTDNKTEEPKAKTDPGELRFQKPKLHATLKVLTRVWWVAFSPDGKTLASAGGDGTIKLWETATGKERASLTGHKVTVHSVAFSPAGKTLASGSLRYADQPNDGQAKVPFTDEIKLWDVASGKNTLTLAGEAGEVLSVAFSPDGKTLASGSLRFGDTPQQFSGEVVLWNVDAGKRTAVLKGHTNTVLSVAFSPDGKTLASGCGDGTIKLWDVASGKNQATLKGHDDDVTSVAFSPDGKILLSGSHDNTVKVWDVAQRKNTASIDVETWVLALAISPDGKTLATGAIDGMVQLWDAANGKEIAELEGHTQNACSVTFSPDGRYLASGSHDSTVKLWRLVRDPNRD